MRPLQDRSCLFTRCRNGATALHVAVLMGSFNMAALLLKVFLVNLAALLMCVDNLCSTGDTLLPQHGANVNSPGKCVPIAFA
jgi:hypothetical protein